MRFESGKYLLAIIFSLGFFACSHKKNYEVKKPDPFLDRQKMAEMLMDIQIFEAGINARRMGSDSTNESMASFYKLVYKKHGVSDSIFRANYNYYLSNPVELDSVYAKTLELLSVEDLKTHKK
jgi:hypothetical protein